MVLRAVVAFVGLMSLLSSAVLAEKRVALVVGNSAYRHTTVLTNPKNDADDIAEALQRLAFDVVKEKDLPVQVFDRVFDAFIARAKDADVALFFFSGHGIQIDKRGYIAPVDLKAETESSALRELVSIQEVVSRTENAAKISVLLFDACRDSPLHERMRRITAEKSRSVIPPKGLPPVPLIGSNTLVVYATVPGETASDGVGRNSPFTASLLRLIATPGLEIELMFKRVTADVLKATNGKQQPERLSRLQSEVILQPARPSAIAQPQPRPRADTQDQVAGNPPSPTASTAKQPELAMGQERNSDPVKVATAQPIAHPFDGNWRVVTTWNEQCGTPIGDRVAQWTIKNSLVRGNKARGTVSSIGELRASWPHPRVANVTVTMSGKLTGNRGYSRWFAKTGGCGGTKTWTRL